MKMTRALLSLAVLGLLTLGACSSEPERSTSIETEDLADPANRRLREGGGGGGQARADTDVDNPVDSPASRDGSAPVAAGGEPVVADTGAGAVEEDVPPPPPPARPASWQDTVDRFADDLVRAIGDRPGAVVVYPTFGTTSPTGAARWGSRLGDDIADRIARKLDMSGRRVLTGMELERAILSTNRGTDRIVDTRTALDLARRMSDLYSISAVVVGDAQTKQGVLGAPPSAEFSLEAVGVRTSIPSLPRVRYSAPKSETADLAREIRTRGRFRIGQDAEPFTPTIEAELSVLSAAQVIGMFEGSSLRGKRIHVQPLAVDTKDNAIERSTAFAKSFNRAMRATEQKLSQQGVDDTFAAAMGGSFSTALEFEGRTYETPLEALTAFEEMQARFRSSRIGRATQGFATDTGNLLKEFSGGEVTIVNPSGREAAVASIAYHAFAAQENGSIDTSTIPFQEAEAPTHVLQCTLYKEFGDNFVMRMTLIDLENANDAQNSKLTLESWATARLERVL